RAGSPGGGAGRRPVDALSAHLPAGPAPLRIVRYRREATGQAVSVSTARQRRRGGEGQGDSRPCAPARRRPEHKGSLTGRPPPAGKPRRGRLVSPSGGEEISARRLWPLVAGGDRPFLETPGGGPGAVKTKRPGVEIIPRRAALPAAAYEIAATRRG